MAHPSFSRNYRLPTLLTSVGLALSGCGGGGGSSTPPELAPNVLSTSPVSGASNVAVTTKLLTAGFSKSMDASSLTATSFRLTCPGNVLVSGVVSYATASSLATLTLPATATLPANATCTATISQSAKDSTGLALAADYVWTFTTATPTETEAPTVTGTIHANGAINVAFNTKVGATFSEAMNPLSINTNSFLLTETATGTKVAGAITYLGVSAVFQPTVALKPSTGYTVTVKGGAGGATDLAGNPLATDFVINWTTGAAADTVAPAVTGTLHANGATNVVLNTKVGATFSEGIDPQTLTASNFTLTTSGVQIPGTIQYTGVSAVFVPTSQLAPSSLYTVTVKGGIGGVTDLAGNPLAQDFVIRWTTGASSDTIAPMVLATNYANGSVDVALNTKVGITFSEGMDPLTVTNTNFVLKTGTVLVPGTVNNTGTNSVFVPLINLLPGTRYTATIKGGAGGVADLAGNRMAADFEASWVTGAAADLTPPSVVATLNDNGDTNVPTNTKVAVRFSETLDPLTITTNNFFLKNGASLVPGTLYAANQSVVFLPLTNLLPNTRYTVTVNGGTGDVADLAGNVLPKDFTYSWTTGAGTDTKAPAVASTTQANGATGVALSAKPGVTFSENVDPLTASTVNFILKEGSTRVAGTVAYNGINMVFTPNSLLKPNTLYTVTIVGSLGGISDLSGNAMNDDYTISWTTGTAN